LSFGIECRQHLLAVLPYAVTSLGSKVRASARDSDLKGGINSVGIYPRRMKLSFSAIKKCQDGLIRERDNCTLPSKKS
jgi:hypothetical protein